MHDPSAEASIKVSPRDNAVDKQANNASPAPVTSTGLTLRAGKC